MFMYRNRIDQNGFTLLEILVALFVFSILSLMLAGALRTVIDAQSGTESKAERLRELQLTFLVMSRDIEQTINRPVRAASGREDAAFIGSSHSFTLTHTGLANPTGSMTRSALQRTHYFWSDRALWRGAWAVLDQAPQSQEKKRLLLSDVTTASFQYLDNDNQFQANWPSKAGDRQALPRAVKVTLTIENWGTISQIYVIPFQIEKKPTNENVPLAPKKS